MKQLQQTLLEWTSVAAVMSLIATTPCRAQCNAWDARFNSLGADQLVLAMSVFDDGSGPALYVGGQFTNIGGVVTSYIAKWDGTSFSALGTGLSDSTSTQSGVYALCVFDDGSGPALFAGGDFSTAGGATVNNVAKWNGTSWSGLSSGMSPTGVVRSLAVFDDGGGLALYAGGGFASAGGVSVNNIAHWNGTSWNDLAAGVTGGAVDSLAVFETTDGVELYAGGSFTTAGGMPASHIAKWNGTTGWHPVDAGINGEVLSLCVFDAGAGASLYAGGIFNFAGGAPAYFIAAWNGTTWENVGGGIRGDPNPSRGVYALISFDDGSGPALYAGGEFTTAGGASAERVARWNGTTWSNVGHGFDFVVDALAFFDAGSGPTLHAGGAFTHAGDVDAQRVAEWNGSDWSVLEDGAGLTLGAEALIAFDDGAGSALYAGGDFTSAGQTIVNRVGKWDGATWHALGDGTNDSVNAFTTFDDGTGLALYAAGAFTTAGESGASRIAKWNGSIWSALGSGINGEVNALTVFDDGTGAALYAGGVFTTAGGVGTNRIAKWNGTSWSALASGVNNAVHALCVFDDGSGPALYVGGAFTNAGGSPASFIAKWNGSAWSVPAGTNALVFALTVFDDGSGPRLHAGGAFSIAGGVSATYIARYNGSSWASLGSGANATVHALATFDDGHGSALYAGGLFTVAGGSLIRRVAKWDGAVWSALSGGVEADCRALAVFDDGSDGAPDLYAAGSFLTAGGTPAANIAEWHGCPPGEAYCFGDGLDPVVTAQCPCSNFGDPGRGCANSNAALGGAHLFASGTTNPNTVLLTCTNIVNNTLCTFMRSKNHDPQGAVFGDGIKCLTSPLFRFGAQNSGQIGNPTFTVAVGAPTEVPGFVWHYTVQYRNPAPGFCNPGTFNASNGYSIDW